MLMCRVSQWRHGGTVAWWQTKCHGGATNETVVRRCTRWNANVTMARWCNGIAQGFMATRLRHVSYVEQWDGVVGCKI